MKVYLLLPLVVGLFSSCNRLPVSAQPGDYDLEATSVTIEPKVIFVGDGVIFSKVITNKGKDKIPARSYDVDLYLEKKCVSFDHSTSDILPGLTVEYGMSPGHHHWKPTAPGTYKYHFVLDENNRLKETNEGNNIISGVIIVHEKPKQAQQDGAPDPK